MCLAHCTAGSHGVAGRVLHIASVGLNRLCACREVAETDWYCMRQSHRADIGCCFSNCVPPASSPCAGSIIPVVKGTEGGYLKSLRESYTLPEVSNTVSERFCRSSNACC